MYKYLMAAVLAVSTCASAPAFSGGTACGPSPQMRKIMSESGMSRIFVGIHEDEINIMELWVSSDGEWISLFSSPLGISCVLTNGSEHEIQSGVPA